MTPRPILTQGRYKVVVLAAGCWLSLGCAGLLPQTESQALAILCDSPSTCDSCLTGPVHVQASKLMAHAQEQISHHDTRLFVIGLSPKTPRERDQHVMTRAQGVGLERCGFVAYLNSIQPEDLASQMSDLCALP